MNDLYLTIHGHFYQPPRENPWTGVIDRQPSATPFNNWNERITSECYQPNAHAKVKVDKDKVARTVNNYENINFNFGPTLVNWFKKNSPGLLKKIIAADRKSVLKNGGHGNAIAQVYNHIIMPLAARVDQETQIIWGLRHFEHTFGRKSEGMWLSETAIGPLTIKLLIDNGVRYTILSPAQARKIRKIGSSHWYDVSNNNINPRRPYRIYDVDKYGKRIHSRHIDVFFYDGPLSVDLSFHDLLGNADNFGRRIIHAYDKKAKYPQILNLASDGEAYGHHKKFGEMALAYLYDRVLKKLNITPLNYGYYLEMFPPKHEVKLKFGPINLGTSWSCSHGVGRWYRNCGCSTGGGKGWTQRWRTPLREALNILKEDLDYIYAKEASRYFDSPWEARNNYIDILCNNSNDAKKRFIESNCKPSPHGYSEKDKRIIWSLMDMQLNSMLMFTSCGWFFSDISGIETIQIIAYAARAIEEATPYTSFRLEKNFLEILKQAESNISEFKNGAEIYIKYVKSLADRKLAV